MTFEEFESKTEEFLRTILVEKNVAINTYRAYKSDLAQFVAFWRTLMGADKPLLGLKTVITRFLVFLYHKKINKSSIARKLSCFQSFENFVAKQGLILNLKLQRPRLDKKLPIYLSVQEIFHILDTVH